METFFVLLPLCVGNSLVTSEFLSQRPVTWSFDVFFGLRLNKRLGKQLRHQWFEMPSYSLSYHCNDGLIDHPHIWYNLIFFSNKLSVFPNSCVMYMHHVTFGITVWRDGRWEEIQSDNRIGMDRFGQFSYIDIFYRKLHEWIYGPDLWELWGKGMVLENIQQC